MKKKWIVAAGVLGVLVLAAAGWLWYTMGRPLYEPGMVRAETGLRSSLDPPAGEDEAGFWRVEADVRLARFSHGTGEPVLVVHGGPGQPIAAPLAALEPLAAEFEFLYWDQRGCGRSTRPIERLPGGSFLSHVRDLDRALGLAVQVADIERIRRLLGAERIRLLGHSFGGFLAALYAAEFPERVERMALVAPADLLVLPAEGGGLLGVIGERLPSERRDAYDEFVDEYLSFGDLFDHDEAGLMARNSRFADWFLEAAGSLSVPSGVRGDPTATGGWMVQAAYLSMGLRHDYRSALAAVKAPVLVLHGAADLAPIEGSRSYVAALPNARLEVIEGAGHFLLFEADAAVSAVIGAFLRGE
ncbi:MAG: alpha/beta hydrolase [Planctomycetota bacterium]